MSLVKNLYYDFDGFALKIPELEIRDEGITVLWGPSGSGKSTILSCLIGKLRPPQMSWRFGDADLAALSVADRRLGVVLQNGGLFDHLTGRENIEFGCRARGLSWSETQDYCQSSAVSLGLGSFYERPARVLSGGEKQRVAFARALIGKPRLLLLDEPFSALDEKNRNSARDLLKKVVEENSLPAVLITHDRQDVDHLADRVHSIANGRIL